MKKTIYGLLIGLLVFFGRPAYAEEISFVTVNWAPYASEFIPEQGISTVILRAICAQAGFEPKFTFLPWKRAMDAVANGKFDALYNAYYSMERAQTYAISLPYLSGDLVLCAPREHKVNWDGTLASLKPYRIGVVLGFVNTKEFDAATDLKKEVGRNDLSNLRMLLRGRLDLIAIDKFQALYLLKNNPTLDGGINDVRFLQPPLEEKELYAMFSRRKPGWRKKMARFNEALQTLIADGTLDDIRSRFGFSEPAQ